LSFIGTREISERVSENIHFDFVAGKNYTSEGGGTQMKGQVSRRNCSRAWRWFVIPSEARNRSSAKTQERFLTPQTRNDSKKGTEMRSTEDLLEGFELHSPEKIRAAIAAGADAKAPIRGKRPIEWLMEMYLRSGRFVECVRVMLEAGATLDDAVLEAMLDDDTQLRKLLQQEPQSHGR
jgi:hypothetical protein